MVYVLMLCLVITCSSSLIFSLNTPPPRPMIASPNAYKEELDEINTKAVRTFDVLNATIQTAPANYSGNITDINAITAILSEFLTLVETMYHTHALKEKMTILGPDAIHKTYVTKLSEWWKTISNDITEINDYMPFYNKKTESIRTKITGLFKEVDTKSKDQKKAIIKALKKHNNSLEKMVANLNEFTTKKIHTGVKLSMSDQETQTMSVLENIANKMLIYTKNVLGKLNKKVSL